MLENLNNLLKTLHLSSPLFVFLTGASGSGKTFLTHALEKSLDPSYVHVAYFDRIGVPSLEDMIREYGSCEEWQKQATYTWIEKLAAVQDKKLIILEGQYNPHFALTACARHNIQQYILVNVHAERAIRERRLREQRNQPELANDTMENWAQFLKKTTENLHSTILDTSDSNTSAHIKILEDLILERLHT